MDTSEGRRHEETFDTTTSAHSRWSDISVLVSLLICMSSSLSRPSPRLILVPSRPRAAPPRRAPFRAFVVAPPVVSLFAANREIRVARCRAAPVFPVRPNKSTTTVSARCVASPRRAVRPYKTRYYCNTGRLIESFSRRFLRRRALYACTHTDFKRPRRAFPPRTDYIPFFFLSYFIRFSPRSFFFLSVHDDPRDRRFSILPLTGIRNYAQRLPGFCASETISVWKNFFGSRKRAIDIRV